MRSKSIINNKEQMIVLSGVQLGNKGTKYTDTLILELF